MSSRSPQPSPRLPSQPGYHGWDDGRKAGPSLAVRRVLGGLACFCFLGQAGYHYGSGAPWNSLWVWDIAALMIGFGIIGHFARLNGAGLLIGALGIPFWALQLMSGDAFVPTALLTHVVAVGLSIAAVRWLGLPRASASTAFIAVALFTALAFFSTPEDSNVNLAFKPLPGVTYWSQEGRIHYAFLGGQWAVGLTFAQFGLRWAFEQIGWLRDAGI